MKFKFAPRHVFMFAKPGKSMSWEFVPILPQMVSIFPLHRNPDVVMT